MKILHVNLAMGYTEGLNYQENCVSKCHAQAGHEVTILTTPYCFTDGVWGPCITSFDYVNDLGVHVIRLPFKYKLPYKLNKHVGVFKGTMKKLEEIQPDVVCIHNIQFQDIRLFAKYKKKHPEVKIFIDNHADFSNSARNPVSKFLLYICWWRPCAKKLEPYTERFFGVMPSRVDFLVDVYGVKRENCEVLVMGADDEAVAHSLQPEVKKGFREQYGITDNDFLIMTGGKIDAFKTQTLLLMEAVRQINRENVKLIVFGSVDKELKDKVEALCDGNMVQYIGWAKGNQSYDYFASSDLVVFPGRHSVYWEQVAGIGIPMLCKYWDGTTHVDIGGNVEFIREDSVEEIKRMIVDLIDNPEKYRNMKEKAEGIGRRMFSYSTISKRAIGE